GNRRKRGEMPQVETRPKIAQHRELTGDIFSVESYARPAVLRRRRGVRRRCVSVEKQRPTSLDKEAELWALSAAHTFICRDECCVDKPRSLAPRRRLAHRT